MESDSSINTTGIAIVGIGCRFPKAKTPEAFWNNLRDGLEFVTEFSKDDLIAAGIDPAILKYPAYVNKGIVLEDIDMFDASFFGLTRLEAELMDPQHRIFLEAAWEALENAGYSSNGYNCSVGVYAGVDLSNYLFMNIYSNPEVPKVIGRDMINLYNDKDFLTSRTSFKLNLQGPSMTVQTTCSTSLIAIIQACQSLLNYQCDIALTGGTAITFPHKMGYFYGEGGISSPDGHCRAFDAQARGTTGGSGSGVLVLKRLGDALEGGDHIEAIIRGFGINNDGSGKVGFTSPSIEGQAEAISAAQAMAQVSPENISYVEAHGTGTSMGDPIEVSALTQVFRKRTNKKTFCGIGSVKTNIGHCNSAAGVAGVIKTVLSLKNRMIPPSLHFTRPNPNIDFASSPFYVVDKLTPWDTDQLPRRAGVSSFGIGGTNGHLVLEEAPESDAPTASRKWKLLLLSAKTPKALDLLSSNLIAHIKNHDRQSLADIAYTLQLGRWQFNHRRMLLVTDTLELSGNIFSNQGRDDYRSVVFMFPGQGSQYVNMGLALYQREPLFKELVDYCCKELEPFLGLNLLDIMYSKNAAASDQLKQTCLAQPALFVVEYCLARLWMSWGIKPDAMIGHSIGELVAACLSGVLSLKDALQLVSLRGKLMQAMPAGAMLVVHQPHQETTALLNDQLSIAAVNTPFACVVSGPFEAVEQLEKLLTQRGIAHQRLTTSHAFHSAMMDGAVDPFIKQMESMDLHVPQIRFLSNVTGMWIDPKTATDPNYWGRQIRSTVQFSLSVKELLAQPGRSYLEVGPGNSLCILMNQHTNQQGAETTFASLPHAKDTQEADKKLTQTLGQLWLMGVNVDWNSYYKDEKRHRVPLPTYPFERERFWIDPKWTPDGSAVTTSKTRDINQWLYEPYWKLSAVPSESFKENINPLGACWLVFCNKGKVCTDLLQKLRRKQKKVFCVWPGEEFSKLEDDAYGINPRNNDHYHALLRDVSSSAILPNIFVSFWTYSDRSFLLDEIANTNGHSNGDSRSDRSLSAIKDFTSLLYLSQAISANDISYPIQLKVVSNGLYQLHDMEKIDSGKSLLVGACKVIDQEYGNVSCQLIDISVDLFTHDGPAVIANQLLEEFAFSSSDKSVMYRNGKRWIQSYQPVSLSVNKSKFKKEGVYLITGGLGGIGFALAKYLAKRYRAKLVLTSRTSFPKEEEWESWIAGHPQEDDISKKIDQFRQLQELGAGFLILQANVNDLSDMERVGELTHQRFGRLNGIIHSAGVAGGGMIVIKKEEQAQKILDPKVKGTLNLEKVFGNERLDFVALCSSLSAIVGGVGQVDYCAANNFQDAFAHEKNKRFGTHYVSINWDTWSEVGMAVNTEVPDELKAGKQEALRNGIRNEEGMELFERILSTSLPQVLVSTSDLLSRIDNIADQQFLSEKSIKQPTGNTLASTHERPKMSVEFVAPQTETQKKITEIWKELLGIEKIGIDDNFLELGGHSLLAIQLSSRVRSGFNVEFSLQSFFEAPTIKSIEAMIENQRQKSNGATEPAKPTLTKLSREKYKIQSQGENGDQN